MARTDALIQIALKHGIPALGVVDWSLSETRDAYAQDAARYRAWLDAGHAGDMGYLPRGWERRQNPELVFPELKFVIAVLVPYSAQPAGASSFGFGASYARYLSGGDYHSVVAERLDAVLREFDPSMRFKVCVDTSAVLERTWGRIAGLGWIGKNNLLIHPQLGSYTFIGVAFTDWESDAAPRLLADYCGSCERCLTACPTGALVAPRELDSRQCISYWTLEKRRELPETARLVSGERAWVAGCDICQEVCPFNTKAARGAFGDPEFLAGTGAPVVSAWADLLAETREQYETRVAGSALSRVSYEQAQRNLRVAMEQAGVGAKRS